MSEIKDTICPEKEICHNSDAKTVSDTSRADANPDGGEVPGDKPHMIQDLQSSPNENAIIENLSTSEFKTDDVCRNADEDPDSPANGKNCVASVKTGDKNAADSKKDGGDKNTGGEAPVIFAESPNNLAARKTNGDKKAADASKKTGGDIDGEAPVIFAESPNNPAARKTGDKNAADSKKDGGDIDGEAPVIFAESPNNPAARKTSGNKNAADSKKNGGDIDGEAPIIIAESPYNPAAAKTTGGKNAAEFSEKNADNDGKSKNNAEKPDLIAAIENELKKTAINSGINPAKQNGDDADAGALSQNSGLRRIPSPPDSLMRISNADARQTNPAGSKRAPSGLSFTRAPSQGLTPAAASARRIAPVPQSADVSAPNPAAKNISADAAQNEPAPNNADTVKNTPKAAAPAQNPSDAAENDKNGGKKQDRVAPADRRSADGASDDAKTKENGDFDIADLPTHMLDVISDEDIEQYEQNRSSADSKSNIETKFGNSPDNKINMHDSDEDDEFDAIHAPNIPSIPVIAPSEFERTIIFERNENRWDDAENYHLPEPGDAVGNYRVLSMLGKGGFGAVYRAKNLTLGREEALKLILPSAKSECGDIDKRFQREVDIVSRLEHPNIVRLYSSGLLAHNVLWMTMELIGGTRMDKRIEKGALSFARAKSYMLQILSGLMEAHRRQIVHRDLKPANIMIERKEGYDEHIVILDFGLSKALGAAEDTSVQELTLADSRRIYGTPQYMAPEQLNMGILGPWTDVYAAGLIFYELLAGHPAVNGDSLFEVAYKQSYEPIQFPAAMRGTAVEAVIARACAKNPAERYNHAGEFFNALQHIQASDDDPSVLCAHLRQSEISAGIMRAQIAGIAQEERTRISMPAIALPENSPKSKREAKREFRSKALFALNIVAYPLAFVALCIIVLRVLGILRIALQ